MSRCHRDFDDVGSDFEMIEKHDDDDASKPKMSPSSSIDSHIESLLKPIHINTTLTPNTTATSAIDNTKSTSSIDQENNNSFRQIQRTYTTNYKKQKHHHQELLRQHVLESINDPSTASVRQPERTQSGESRNDSDNTNEQKQDDQKIAVGEASEYDEAFKLSHMDETNLVMDNCRYQPRNFLSNGHSPFPQTIVAASLSTDDDTSSPSATATSITDHTNDINNIEESKNANCFVTPKRLPWISPHVADMTPRIPNNNNSNDVDSISSSSTVAEGAAHTTTEISLLLDAPNKVYPRKRRFLFVEKIRNNRQIHRMRNPPGKRLLLADHYCVEEVLVTNNRQQHHPSQYHYHTPSDYSMPPPPPRSVPTRLASRFLRIPNRNQNHNDIHYQGNVRRPPQPARVRKKLVVLPGVLKYEADWARDSHDFFNLIALVPLIALNFMNWNWDMIFDGCNKMLFHSKNTNSSLTGNSIITKKSSALQSFLSSIFMPVIKRIRFGRNFNRISAISSSSSSSMIMPNRIIGTLYNIKVPFIQLLENSWTGEWFDLFLFCAVSYFIIDLLWILIVPQAVRSPSTIVQHHIATLFYILIPYYYSECRWCMGCCMMVEINTWFLIARRVFNKQGFPPWTIVNLKSFLSIRIKVISLLFYVTWISIRVILYPLLLIPFFQIYIYHSLYVANTYFNLLSLCIPLHTIFCLLNLKWTYDLLMSKIRYWKRLYRNNNTMKTSNSRQNIHHPIAGQSLLSDAAFGNNSNHRGSTNGVYDFASNGRISNDHHHSYTQNLYYEDDTSKGL